MLMGMLFRNSDLETRFSLNMNVLIDGRTPKVCSLREVLRAFLDHRREVLLRRSQHRLDKIDARLEILEGYIVAYLNLDRVIEIIRYEDEPKAVMMAEFDLSDAQAEAILNMRLRSLRKLEEMELRRERDALLIERAQLDDILGSERLQWKKIGAELAATQKQFGKTAPGGGRRSRFAQAAEIEEVPIEAMIEREPITVVCSKMGWIRAMKGHLPPEQDLKFKDGDERLFSLHAETTDKIVLFASNGRFFTIGANNLPGGRGMGEPVRLMVDLPNEAAILALFVHKPGTRLLLASSEGDGFVVASDDVIAQTRGGKAVLTVREGAQARVCRPVAGDHVAVVGENRKVLVFALDELPEMARGKGVRLQKYKDGGLSDATTFVLAEGLSWKDPAGRTRTESDLGEWLGKRASAGRMAPRGFPRDNRFN
jgi:topoisomerase IV subunit A